MKFIIDDKIPYINGILEQFGEVRYISGKSICRNDVKDADALIIRTRTKVNRELLEGSKIRFVATATIGFDHIDRNYLKEAGIQWTSCPGCNSESVGQYLTSTLVELSERHSIDLNGKTMGIIGVGNVGSKIKVKAEALGMNVILNDPPRADTEGPEGFSELDYLIENSDFITTHVPLFRDGEYKTLHLVDESFLQKMKDNAFIVNTSRGEVINNSMLREALKSQVIKGAVLDVWENEPEIDLELLNLVDIGTSHIAGYSADGKSNGTSMSIQAISKFFNLNVDDWFPNNVPMPEPVINVTKEGFEGVKETVRKTFDILTDVTPLKDDPSSFEYNRGNYQLRREFHNYTLTGKVTEQLLALGFRSQ
jgi:erythronate-4-phosphate dehydrogenase